MSKELLELVLASQSPRRRELLSWLEIPFAIRPSEVEEVSDATEHHLVAEDLARLKGQDILKSLYSEGKTNVLVVASDTMVCDEDKIYGKPKDTQQAREFLLRLSGHTHQVISSLYLGSFDPHNPGQILETTSHVKTAVTFSDFESEEEVLENYLKTGDSLDKAGAYGIQGPSLTFIEKISGSYSNVVGLPLYELRVLMKAFLSQHYGHRQYLRDYFVKS